MNLFDQEVGFQPQLGKRLYLSYGGGVDSTAIAVECVNRVRAGDRRFMLEGIVFADTGGEKPETYAYVKMFSTWLMSQGFPAVTWVRKEGLDAVPDLAEGLYHEEPVGLEAKCLRLETLPPVAFGWRTCTDVFKIRPFAKHVQEEQLLRGESLAGISCLIGFEVSEAKRVERALRSKAPYDRIYPLVLWGWTRLDCIRVILRAGLTVPPKSACFFCPNSKRLEVSVLSEDHPILARRAAMMESNTTKATSIVGLGRDWRWTDLIVAQEGVSAHITEIFQ